MTFSIPLDQYPFSCRDAHLFLGPEFLSAEGRNSMLTIRCVPSSAEGAGSLLLLFGEGDKAHSGGIETGGVTATPTLLSVSQKGLAFEVFFSSPRNLVFCGSGNITFKTALAATGAFAYKLNSSCWCIDFPGYDRRLLLRVHEGILDTEIAWNGQYSDYNRFFLSGKERWLFTITDYDEGVAVDDICPDPVRCQQWVTHDWNQWLAGPVCLSSGVYEGSRLMANYLQWSHQIGARSGRFSSSIVSSLAGTAVSVVVEQCVHAIAIQPRHPDLAWKLWRGTFDFMSGSGQIPDQFSAMGSVSPYSAPPVQGWAMLQMIQRGWFPDTKQLEEALHCLEQNTMRWIGNPLKLPNGMPYYRHGRESGWADSSLFLTPPPFQSPDLFVFLILQVDALISFHQMKGGSDRVAFWENRQQELLRFLQEKLWFGSEFVTLGGDGGMICNSQSLLKMMPLLLGARLPSEPVKMLMSELQSGGYINEFGLASEAIGSRWFQRQSPQRGAVWPVGNYFIFRGLVEAGYPSLARTLRQKLLRGVALNGFREAYNVLSGFSIGSAAHPVTASVFLAMLDEL